jgi:hypothetical protein
MCHMNLRIEWSDGSRELYSHSLHTTGLLAPFSSVKLRAERYPTLESMGSWLLLSIPGHTKARWDSKWVIACGSVGYTVNASKPILNMFVWLARAVHFVPVQVVNLRNFVPLTTMSTKRKNTEFTEDSNLRPQKHVCVVLVTVPGWANPFID